MKDRQKLISTVIIAGAVVAMLLLYFVPSPRQAMPPGASAAAPTQSPEGATGNPFLDTVFGGAEPTTSPGTGVLTSFEVVQRLLLAVLLSAVLAFRPRQNVPLFRRSLFVSQTQILLAVVAAALMMIVGDNAARAFAIFAAVSLVRFRTNIRDPKEVTVLLISLSLGLAAGVGHWDLGIALCLFALALLWVLELREPDEKLRFMELSVKSSDPEFTQEILRKIFKRLKIEAEVREIVPPDPEKKKNGSISYYLSMRISLTTDRLSDRILAADEEHIEGIQWSKTKSVSDIYV